VEVNINLSKHNLGVLAVIGFWFFIAFTIIMSVLTQGLFLAAILFLFLAGLIGVLLYILSMILYEIVTDTV
jgi:hypothetical protein